ncbi:MAG: trans-2-enoyl-CoA reductase family protein [Desulfobacterales bacterium]|jgi:enoyl-[acyl-carrier protein] reductase/trans-2-enoyl-CoA reductase (NAD+)
MIIKPKIWNNMCVTAHPLGCAAQVRRQINYVKAKGSIKGPKKTIVIGASNGYGLAARIVSTFNCGSATIGVAYEHAGKKTRPATAGWYNTESFKAEAQKHGYPAWNINGDAFSEQIKTQVVQLIKEKLGQVDFLVYSIAAPRRIDPTTGEIYSSAIKPIGKTFTAKTIDFLTGKVSHVTSNPATEKEIVQTIKVMGGEDWFLWTDRLFRENLIKSGFLTIAFSYMGPGFTKAIYRDGTIGRAKQDLEFKADEINKLIAPVNGKAIISVNKALVTRASAVIPAVPLYIALLYKVMKEKHLHEGCIEQIYRLYHDVLFTGKDPKTDSKGRVRMDDREMRKDVQQAVSDLWKIVETKNLDNIENLGDMKGLREEFLRHHGFGMPGVDYRQEVTPDIF